MTILDILNIRYVKLKVYFLHNEKNKKSKILLWLVYHKPTINYFLHGKCFHKSNDNLDKGTEPTKHEPNTPSTRKNDIF